MENDFKVSLSSKSYLILNYTENRRCRQAAFFVHSPYEMPLNVPYKSFTKLIFGTSMEVLIKPVVIKASENIRAMDLQDRKCYFDNEFRLKYFKHYTKYHCDMEVLSDTTFERCGCVPFNYIRNQSMNICSIYEWFCAIAASTVVLEGKGNTEFSQHCLPLCDSISYDVETIVTRVANNYSYE